MVTMTRQKFHKLIDVFLPCEEGAKRLHLAKGTVREVLKRYGACVENMYWCGPIERRDHWRFKDLAWLKSAVTDYLSQYYAEAAARGASWAVEQHKAAKLLKVELVRAKVL